MVKVISHSEAKCRCPEFSPATKVINKYVVSDLTTNYNTNWLREKTPCNGYGGLFNNYAMLPWMIEFCPTTNLKEFHIAKRSAVARSASLTP